MDAKAVLTSMLAEADIRVGGDRPWDIRVHNEGLYKRVLREGTLGAGEAYLEGWWDCDQLDVMFCKALHAHLEDKVRRNLPNALIVASQLLFNLQSVARAPMVAEQHYNTDNAMFARMLGPTMNYSCGYWKDAETLDEAQRNKMDLICRKLDLKEGMSVLDIGCGWGGLSLYMAKEYGVKVTGVTISTEQLAYAREHDAGHLVNWLLQDYRSMEGQFDRIVSVGMFEHVVAELTIVMCFQSLILDMAGNVGTQSLAVTIRVLMDESLTGKQKLELVWKEMRIGLCNGGLLGILSFALIGLYIYLFKGKTLLFSYAVSGCIGVALLLAMLISSAVGTCIPLFFKKINIDPAVASGPLITTVNDLVAVITYYGLSWLFLLKMLNLAG